MAYGKGRKPEERGDGLFSGWKGARKIMNTEQFCIECGSSMLESHLFEPRGAGEILETHCLNCGWVNLQTPGKQEQRI